MKYYIHHQVHYLCIYYNFRIKLMILSYRMNCNKKDKVIENIRNEIHRINIQRDDSDNSVNVFFELIL